jgi:hypothetical protein
VILQDFKISFYVNSHVDKLFVTMSVVVRRDGECGTTVKGNDGGGWSSDGVVLWLVRRQNRDVVE